MTAARRISVICAPPNGRNTGMASVDMAFADLVQAIPDAEVTYWRLWDSSEWIDPVGLHKTMGPDGVTDPDTGLHYRVLRGRLEEALSADTVVFWGDFLHMAVYIRQTADVLHRRMGVLSNPAAGLAMAQETYLLTASPASVLRRTMTYGTTLGMNAPADYVGDYGRDLALFHDRVGGAWHRDSYSAQVARLTRGTDQSCQGPDAAFLLGQRRTGERHASAKVFFGRSDMRPEVVAEFGRRLTRSLDLKPELLMWGEEPAFWPMMGRRRFRAAWPELERSSSQLTQRQRAAVLGEVIRGGGTLPPVPTPDQLFDEIAGARVVITDTYHLAVNAWRLGTPAVMVLDGPTAEWNVNAGEPGSRRDKRHDLYSQLDALGLLVDGAVLGRGSAREAERVTAHLQDTALLEHTHARVAALREVGRRTVLTSLTDPGIQR